MTQLIIDTGAAPNDGTGDPLRTAFTKVNYDFTSVYDAGPVGSNIQITDNRIITINTNGNLVLAPNGIGNVVSNVNILPNMSNIRSLGSSAYRWDSTYTRFLDAGSANITSVNIGNANIGNISTITIDVANIHILGGTNGYVLQTDGTGNLTWTAQTGGSGNGTPGGANTQIQYNDAGTFGGAAGFTFDNVANVLNVPGNVSAGNVLTSEMIIANGEIQSGTGFFTGGYLSVNGNTDLADVNVSGNLSAVGNILSNSLTATGVVYAGTDGQLTTSNSMTFADVGGEMTLTVDYFSTSTVFTNDILGSGNSINVSAQYGNSVLFDTTGGVSATGDVTANAFIGDGSQLTNIPAAGISGQIQINWLGSFSNQGGTPGDTYSTLQFDSNGMPILNGTTAYQQRVDYSPYLQVLAPRVESTDFGIIAGPAIQITGYADDVFYNTPRSAYLSVQDQANATQQWDFGILGNGSNAFSVRNRTASTIPLVIGTDGAVTASTIITNDISSDDSSFVTIQDGLDVVGDIEAHGNVTADYVIGDGSQLTGISVGNNGAVQVNWQGSLSNQGGTPGDTYSTLQFDSNGIPTLDGTTAYQQRVDYSPYLQVLAPRVESTDFGVVAGPGVTVVGYDDNYNTPRSAYLSVQDQAATTQQWDFGILGYGANSFDIRNSTANTIPLSIDPISDAISAVGNLTAGNISAAGNISGTYFFGDGRYISNITVAGGTKIVNGNSWANVETANGNMVINTNGSEWTFGTDGSLTLPQGVTLGDYPNAGPRANTAALSGTLVYLSSTDGNAWVGVEDGTPSIGSTPTTIWSFGANGNLTAPGNISASGNVTGDFILGNIAFANGIPATYGNANVANYLPTFSGNLTAGNISATGNVIANIFSTSGPSGNITGANVISATTISATGNITGSYILGNIAFANGIPATYGNANVANYLPTFSGNLTAGNISATGNITGSYILGNIAFANGIPATYGNANVANYLPTFSGNLTAGNISVTGNVTGNYILGNIAFANGIPATYGNANVATFLSAYGSNTISTTGNITAGNIIVGGTANTGVYALDVGAPAAFLSNTVSSFTANVNNYTQVTLQNLNTGADATADFILTANNGNDTVNYSDFGIINSGYDNATPTNSLGNIVFAADTYLYAQGNTGNASQSGGNLAIGTTVPGKNVKIFAGGITNSAIVANISNTGVAVTGTVSATGNITTAGNFVGNGAALTNVTVSVAGNVIGTQSNVNLVAGSYNWSFNNTGNLTLPGNTFAVNYANNTPVNVVTKFEGTWTVPTGNSTQSFTVAASETYYMWVDCNIPNGILVWNATATITNTNVPVVGAQYAWVYNGGGTPVDFTSIPSQFTGTANTIVRSNVAPSATTNKFDFGINNTSGGNVTVRYGWIQISY